jgi:hypothetical protein
MTRHRKTVRKKRSQGTAHYRAMAKPEAQNLVSILRSGWEDMDFNERGQRSCELVSLGCSVRGLETELNQSATSIRRHMELVNLPEEDRKAIEAGRSAKGILALKASVDRDRRRQKRIDEDQKTGALSDRVATTILEFCRAKEGPNRVPVYGKCALILLNRVRRILDVSDAAGFRKVRVSTKKGERRLFNKTRPPLKRGTKPGWHQEEWLANIVWAMAPERPIWDRALKKANGRIKELEPKKAPIDAYWDRQVRLAGLSNIPPRPIFQGARSMQRQGKPASTTRSRKPVS